MKYISKIQRVPRDRNVSKPMGRKISVQNPAYRKEAATCNHTPTATATSKQPQTKLEIVTNPFCSVRMERRSLLGIAAKEIEAAIIPWEQPTWHQADPILTSHENRFPKKTCFHRLATALMPIA